MKAIDPKFEYIHLMPHSILVFMSFTILLANHAYPANPDITFFPSPLLYEILPAIFVTITHTGSEILTKNDHL
jgi:hypothetical protein